MGTGTSPTELEFLAVVTTGTFTEPEVTWWYTCTAKEVEWREPTAVRYLMQRMLPRPYTLACTILLVSHFQHIIDIGADKPEHTFHLLRGFVYNITMVTMSHYLPSTVTTLISTTLGKSNVVMSHSLLFKLHLLPFISYFQLQ